MKVLVTKIHFKQVIKVYFLSN